MELPAIAFDERAVRRADQCERERVRVGLGTYTPLYLFCVEVLGEGFLNEPQHWLVTRQGATQVRS